MRFPPLGPELRELLGGSDHELAKLRQLLENCHPKEAAEMLTCLLPEEITTGMSLLPIEMERDMFRYFEPDLQERIVLGSSRSRVGELLEGLPSDERAEFLEGLDDQVRRQLLPLLARETRQDLLRRESFEDDQVGAIMSTEFCALGEELTIPRALDEVRIQASSKETIYYSYALDQEGKLKGFVSLRDLIVSEQTLTVGAIMKTELVSVPVSADQEEAARLIREYDLLALPVLDEESHMVGIVTYDDAVDILEEENTEDIKLIAGITAVEDEPEEYLASSVITHYRGRVAWLTVLAMSFLFIAIMIDEFGEGIITPSKSGDSTSALTLMAIAFLPLLLATGANVGGQASALVLRGLTVQSLSHGDMRQVVWKEARVGLLLCATLGSVVFGLTWLFTQWNPTIVFDPMIGLAIAAAVGAHVLTAAMVGALIPLVFSRLGWQPEVFSLPALNCVSDTAGTVIYIIVLFQVGGGAS